MCSLTGNWPITIDDDDNNYSRSSLSWHGCEINFRCRLCYYSYSILQLPKSKRKRVLNQWSLNRTCLENHALYSPDYVIRTLCAWCGCSFIKMKFITCLYALRWWLMVCYYERGSEKKFIWINWADKLPH